MRPWRLSALLALRTRAEERAATEYGRALVTLRDAETTACAAADALRTTWREDGAAGVTAGGLAAGKRFERRLEEHLRAANGRRVEAAETAGRARGAMQAARREREALALLHSLETARRRREALAWEQEQLEETSAAARRQHAARPGGAGAAARAPYGGSG